MLLTIDVEIPKEMTHCMEGISLSIQVTATASKKFFQKSQSLLFDCKYGNNSLLLASVLFVIWLCPSFQEGEFPYQFLNIVWPCGLFWPVKCIKSSGLPALSLYFERYHRFLLGTLLSYHMNKLNAVCQRQATVTLEPWKCTLQTPKYRECNWSRAPATVQWNPLWHFYQSHALTGCFQLMNVG